jgi:hypothetical protein
MPRDDDDKLSLEALSSPQLVIYRHALRTVNGHANVSWQMSYLFCCCFLLFAFSFLFLLFLGAILDKTSEAGGTPGL